MHVETSDCEFDILTRLLGYDRSNEPENMVAYWDRDVQTVKLSITLFREGDNKR